MDTNILSKAKIFAEKEGYTIVDTFWTDYGKTVKLLLEKNGENFILPVSECFYDTDDFGKMTKFHGVIKIQETKWFKEHNKEK